MIMKRPSADIDAASRGIDSDDISPKCGQRSACKRPRNECRDFDDPKIGEWAYSWMRCRMLPRSSLASPSEDECAAGSSDGHTFRRPRALSSMKRRGVRSIANTRKWLNADFERVERPRFCPTGAGSAQRRSHLNFPARRTRVWG